MILKIPNKELWGYRRVARRTGTKKKQRENERGSGEQTQDGRNKPMKVTRTGLEELTSHSLQSPGTRLLPLQILPRSIAWLSLDLVLGQLPLP